VARDYDGLRDILFRLDRLRSRWRRSRVAEGGLIFLTAFLSIWLLSTLFEGWIHFGVLVRQALRAFLLLAAVVALLNYVIRRLAQDLTDEEFALLAEARVADCRNLFINSVRLAKEEHVPSPALVNAAIREAARETESVGLEQAVDKRGVRRYGLSASVLVLCALLLLGLFPRMRNATARLIAPGSNIPQVGSVVITKVTPGKNVILVAGSGLEVGVEVKEAGRDVPAELVYRTQEGQWKTHRMRRAAENRFLGAIRDIRVPLEYYIEIADTQTQRYRVDVVEPPTVARIDIEYRYPAYTGLEHEKIEDSDGSIRAVAGTAVKLRIGANKRLKSGYLKVNEKRVGLLVEPDRRSLVPETPLIVRENGSYTIHLIDEQGYTNQSPPTRSIQAVPDEKPVVKIARPGRDMVLPIGRTLSVVVRGSDDFGVAAAELVVRRKGTETETEEVIHAWRNLSGKNVTVSWDWLFDEQHHAIGDKLRYYVRMRDNNDVTGPGIGKSAEYQVTIEDVQARIEAMKKKYGNWYTRLEQVLRDQQQVKHRTEQFTVPEPK